MGFGVILLRSNNITKAQWDQLITIVNTFINNNPAYALILDKGNSEFREPPP